MIEIYNKFRDISVSSHTTRTTRATRATDDNTCTNSIPRLSVNHLKASIARDAIHICILRRTSSTQQQHHPHFSTRSKSSLLESRPIPPLSVFKMSHQKFSFAEAPASGKAGSHLGPAPATRKHRRKKVLPLHSSSKLSFDASLDSTICDDSTGTLTYSSSSQAGESTDSEHNYCGEEEQNSLNYSEDDEASLHRQQVRDTTG